MQRLYRELDRFEGSPVAQAIGAIIRRVYYDALTTYAVRDELRALIGGRVEKVFLPAELAIGLELYASGRRHWLLASASPQHPRLYLASERLARAADEVSPLLLLLRKYVKGARLAAVEQLRHERVLCLDFLKRDGVETLASQLVVEVMARYSNIVLLDADGQVLDAAKRVTAEMNRRRVTLPRHPYVPPPPQPKGDPLQVSADELRASCLAAEARTPLWQALVGALRAISPLAGRELAFRATGDAECPVSRVERWDRVHQAVRELFGQAEAGQWTPCVVREEGRVVAFAPYRLTHRPAEPVATIGAALEAFYEQLETVGGHEQIKEGLRQVLAERRAQLEHKRAALERALASAASADQLRRAGEYLLAFQHLVAPGQRELEMDDLRIPLDPERSPVENAQAIFQEYRRARNAVREVPAILEETRLALAYLDQIEVHLDVATSREQLDELRADLVGAGFLPQPSGKRAPKAKRPRITAWRSSDGFEVLVGHSASQNELITFELAGPNDLWLHARGVPGAHVLVRTGGQEVPERTLLEAARLAAAHSQARHDGQVAVDWTQKRQVRRIPGGPPGLVTYTHERTVRVKPAT